MPIDFDDVRRRHSLRAQIENYGSKVKAHGKFRCVIPGHLDKTASANIVPGTDELKWHCHGCGKGGDVIDMVCEVEGCTPAEAVKRLTGGMPPRRDNPPPPKESGPGLVFRLGPVPDNAPLLRARYETPQMLTRQGKLVTYVPEMVYVYRTPEGQEVGRVLRIKRSGADKYYTQARWCLDRKAWVNVGWSGDDRAPLYNAAEMHRRPDAPVLLVEGEKCADHAKLALKDWVVTAWCGGSGAAAKSDFSQLDGREVTVWPDNDETGIKAMRTVLGKIRSDRLYWLEPSKDWKKGYDVADLIADEGIGAPASFLQGRERQTKAIEAPQTGDWLPVSRGGWFPDSAFVELTKEGTLNVKSEVNARTVLLHHPHFASLAFDVVTRQIVFHDKEISAAGYYDLLRDTVRLSRVSIASTKFIPIVEAVAMGRPVNHVADKLLALANVWDKVHRPLAPYAGVRLTNWSKAAFRVWMLGLVRRILEPGCQHDIMLVLEGPQGIQKTSFLRVLGNAFGFDGFAEVEKLSSSDNGMMILDGKYIVELGEMVAYRRADIEAFKKTLTSKVDRYRRPYARQHVDMPRTCVFAGTTNKLDNYLRDPSGNRRIAPVKVEDRMRLNDLERDLPQIFAEHVDMFQRLKKAQAGAPINWFSLTEEDWQAAETGKREVLDVFIDELDAVLEGKTTINNGTLYAALGISMRDRRVFQEEIKSAMERRGWKLAPRETTRDGRAQGPVWVRVEKH